MERILALFNSLLIYGIDYFLVSGKMSEHGTKRKLSDTGTNEGAGSLMLAEDCENFTIGTVFSNITYSSDDRRIPLQQFLVTMKELVAKRFLEMLQDSVTFKAYIIVRLHFAEEPLRNVRWRTAFLQTSVRHILNATSIDTILAQFEDEINQRYDSCLPDHSNLKLKEIQEARLSVAQCSLLGQATFSRVPEYLLRKKTLINVTNEDNRCFGYALLSCLESVSEYKFCRNSTLAYDRYFEKYKLDTLQYPVELCHIINIEQQLKIALNVYGYYDDKGHERYPIYVSDSKFETTIDLFYWEGRYAWIRNFSRFMAGTTTGKCKETCRRCLERFKTETTLLKHAPQCKGLIPKRE